MLNNVSPKLPMRDKEITRDFYLNQMGFSLFGSVDYEGYLLLWSEIFLSLRKLKV